MKTRITASGYLLFLIAACAGGVLGQEPKPAPPPGMPAGAGVFHQQSSGKWAKLDPAYVDESKVRGMNAFLQTEGLTALNMNYEYLGVEAPLQLAEKQPVFYVRGTGSPAYAQIVELTKKKDRRTARTVSTEVSVGNRGGFKRDKIRAATVTALSDGSYSVRPVNDLKPGEYLLALGSAVIGYDFGITQKQ